MKPNKMIAIFIAVLLVIVIGYIAYGKYKDSNISKLSLCLTEKKVVFYGADWCPNCKIQKELFGKHFSNIDYVECNLDHSLPMEEICVKKGISRYPTWIQNDDKKIQGVMKLSTLAKEFGCE